MVKAILAGVILICWTTIGYTSDWGYSSDQYQWGKDAWGHRTKYENYYKDPDGDGVPNYLDRNDNNKMIQ